MQSTNGSTRVLSASSSWDFGYRLRGIQNTVRTAISLLSGHTYVYDDVDRRTHATLADSSAWTYDYNDRNELTGARRSWADFSPVSAQQLGYVYDPIGNRTSAQTGGDVNGTNSRTTAYTPNALNQYASVTTPGYEDILGVALATNSVTVNSLATDRKGEYYHREITGSNGSGPVWQSVSVVSASFNTNGGFVFPRNVQSYTYDPDGNLTFDGVWSYEWDGENQLKALTMTNVSGIPDAQRKRLEFCYDYADRRVSKTECAPAHRRHASPLNAGRQFGRAVHAQPCSPAAVSGRWAARHVTRT